MIMTPEQKLEVYNTLRRPLDRLIPVAAGDASVINDVVSTLRTWEPGTRDKPVKYAVNDVRMYGGIPYRCNQAHAHYGEPGYEPGVAAMWSAYHGTSYDTARPFQPVTNAEDRYKAGEYMIWTDGTVRKAVRDTSFGPNNDFTAWEIVTGNEMEPEELAQNLPMVWDDHEANHSFAVGDKFSDGGIVYIVNRAFFKQDHLRPPALLGDFYEVYT